MIKRLATLALLTGAVAMSYAASAAPKWEGPGQPKPMFNTIADHSPLNYPKGMPRPAGTLAQWNGSFTDLTGGTTSYRMIGADPATSNTDTHIKVILIPVVMVYGASNGNMTFDPSAKNTSGFGKKSVMKALPASPIFDQGSDFQSGAVDCGTGQYIDVYQRCNFWGHVSTNTGYHTVLDVTKVKKVKPLTINVTSAQGKVIANPFGDGNVGTMTQGAFDAQLTSYLSSHAAQITPDVFPLFISYDIYLTSGGCCIGGYHNARGTQTYGYSTWVDQADSFSEDISAISHEIGEWADDPFVNNRVRCTDNSLMENGDPLVPVGEFGTFEKKVGKNTYHPQSLVYLPYFGAPTSTSANGWYSFQGPSEMNDVCPGPQR